MPVKLLFQEAEVTSSLSSNVVKGYTIVGMGTQEEDKRIIDTNTLAAKKLEVLASVLSQTGAKEASTPRQGGFVAGLAAEDVTDMLTQDAEGIEEGEETQQEAPQPEAEPEPVLTAEDILREANYKAGAIVEDAKAKAQEILADAKEEAEKMLREAKDVGYEEGFQSGNSKAEALYDIKESELTKRAEALEQEYAALFENVEAQLVDTITGIYEHIFQTELGSYRDILIHLIGSTMRAIEGGRDFVIHVSKEDYPYVSMQKKSILEGCATANISVEIIEDSTLSKNDCLIETEGGIFDCGLSTQLHELRQRLQLLSYQK